MQEIWKSVPDTNDNYQVSNLGNVRSRHNKYTHKIDDYKLLKPYKTKKGYLSVKIKEHKTARPVHRLVAQAFIPNLENKPQVNHIDGSKENNNVNNLEWCTNQENCIHAVKMGLSSKNNKERPVIQYDLEGNFIKQWESIASAEKTLNISHIYCVCNKTKYRHTAGGYKWEFANDRNS